MVITLSFFYFFFGNILDLVRNIIGNSVLLRYRYIFLIAVVFFSVLFFLLRRSNNHFTKLTFYLNILFLLLIVFDLGLLVIKIPAENKKREFFPAKEGFTLCDSCTKPDIYLIIPDEYPGFSALKEDFGFDNSSFQTELEKRNFHIADSRSNYNSTPFSVASTLGMQLLPLSKKKQDYNTVRYSYEVIRHSPALKFLNASGYKFYNCSIFDFDGQPAHEYAQFLPYGINLVTAQTLKDRVMNDFRQDVIDGKTGFKDLQKKLVYENLHFNDDILNETVSIASEKNAEPKFVYTHLMMPHSPYYYDSKGNASPMNKLNGNSRWDTAAFIQYLQYTNNKLLWLVDKILSSSATPPVIIILSDHGFRFRDNKLHPHHEFTNLNTIYFPDKNYNEIYDSISNVNLFRVIFNKYFKQQLPLLPDTTINLRGD